MANRWGNNGNLVPQFISVQFSLSLVSDSLRPHKLQHARPPCPLHLPEFSKFMSIVSVMLCSHLILWHPLLLLLSIFPSIRVFSNESAVRIRWPNYWSFSFSISPSSKYSGLISLKIDWFDLLLPQGLSEVFSSTTVRKTLILRRSTFFTVQLSQPYMTTGKTTALTMWTFVSRVMSLLFNTLSRFVTAFLPRSKLLISWLQSPSTVILGPKKRRAIITSTRMERGAWRATVRGVIKGQTWLSS